MILLVHPSGNANVRAVAAALQRSETLARFLTTLGWSNASGFLRLMPLPVRKRLARRSYFLPDSKIRTHPSREIARLLGAPVSVDAVWRNLDSVAARYLRSAYRRDRIRGVYTYEDCAEQTLTTAEELGLRRIYDLPIAYWETARRLLKEEAERYPEWESTLGGTRDPAEKLARKTRELELAELVVCPSNFVLESLPQRIRETKPCLVAPFGSPESPRAQAGQSDRSRRALRVLFAGALTQRKGLADLFTAMQLVASENVELVVMGSLLRPLDWYRQKCPNFTYEPPRPHAGVLALMRTCDVFVLPSIVEGRALVQQEALACGLPLIATRNAGADDVILEGETGFLIPIRSPEAIAEKINWFAAHPAALSGMANAAQERARELTWDKYGQRILASIQSLLNK